MSQCWLRVILEETCVNRRDEILSEKNEQKVSAT